MTNNSNEDNTLSLNSSSNIASNGNKTALFETHLKYGGRIVNFAGWQLPVRYTEIIEEHLVVRNSVGVFDVSHMGEIIFEGEDAAAALNYLTCNDVNKLIVGKAQYNAILNESGGVVDDIIIYCLAVNKYLVVVNASNVEKDFTWVTEKNIFTNVTISNNSLEYSQIAVQGEKAVYLMTLLLNDEKLAELPRFSFEFKNLFNQECILARTGYTGSDGFEIYCPNEIAKDLWELIFSTGKENNIEVKPCGLGSRDSLRLEAGYPLYGHELRDDLLATESGLSWIVKLDKKSSNNEVNFIGKESLIKAKTKGLKKHLVGLKIIDAGLARENALVFDMNLNQIGFVTSGTKTPTLTYAIAMAIVDSPNNSIGTKVFIEVRGKKLSAEVVKLPFIGVRI